MAEVVSHYKFKCDRIGVDWDKVLDGQTWFLERGKDFDAAIPVESFRGLAYVAAKNRGMAIKVNKGRHNGADGFFVRGVKPE